MTRLKAMGPNAPQIEHWNGPAGEHWAGDAFRERQDKAVGPFGEATMDTAEIEPGQHVLDIGCGSGTTTFEIASRVGPSGSVLGVDISTPQIERAIKRAEALGNPVVEFWNQDVATFPFEAGSFDRVFSRFGIMFFVQPVPAFAHIRSEMKSGGRIAFSCWESPERNPWLANTTLVATRYLPKPAPVGPEDPGPFSFRNPDRVNRILSEAGFTGIEITLVKKALKFEPDIASSVAQLIQYGPMRVPIAEAPEDVRERIKAELGDLIRDYQTTGGVMIDGAAWIVTAKCLK